MTDLPGQRFTDRPLAEQLQELTNSTFFAYFVIDQNTTILLTTAGGASILSSTVSALLGKTLSTFVHNDDKEAFLSMVTAAANSGTESSLQYRILSHVGSWRWAESLCRRSSFDPSAVICETHDITLNKLITDSLQDSLDWLTNVMDAFRDAVFIEENERVAFINTAFVSLYGYSSADEIVGRHVSEFQSDDDSQRMLNYTRTRVEGKYAPQVYQFYGKKKDGSYLLLEASVSTLYFGPRKIIVTVIHDLSDPTLL